APRREGTAPPPPHPGLPWPGPNAGNPTSSAARDAKHDAAILGPAGLGRVIGDRLRLAVAVLREPHALDAVSREVLAHGMRALLGELLVVRVGAGRIRVAGALDVDVRVAIERGHGVVEGFRGVSGKSRRIELEVHSRQLDLFLDLAALVVDAHAARRARALVLRVRNAVAVAVHHPLAALRVD